MVHWTKCVDRCASRRALVLKLSEHLSQLNQFSPIWEYKWSHKLSFVTSSFSQNTQKNWAGLLQDFFMCLVSSCRLPYSFLHFAHPNPFSPVWVIRCPFKVCWFRNLFSQKTQEYRRGFLWEVFICLESWCGVRNSSGHCWQRYPFSMVWVATSWRKREKKPVFSQNRQVCLTCFCRNRFFITDLWVFQMCQVGWNRKERCNTIWDWTSRQVGF